ncbi:MAG: recombinase family protein [Candidatus Metalachnospira sp.]|nr:recombinase family protein [Candidatus Metalachnospira sp.]
MKEIIEINKLHNQEKDKKRVAAYCRVSTNLPEQGESFETQVRYYQTLIEANPDWENAGIYADEGYSGTTARHRPEFMRLIKDALSGKIDIIITKSISRFARNTVDCQTYTKKLKRKGVEVRFEREGISSFDSTMDFIFTVLAAVAQEESRVMSQNMHWAYVQNFKKGIYHMGSNHMLGFDADENGNLIPNEDAWIPRFVITSYAEGMDTSTIAKELNDMNAKRIKSKKPFDVLYVYSILKNEKYVGDMMMQKSAPAHYLTHRPQKGIDYKSYYVKNSHQGVVSREVWESAQKRLKEYKQKKADNPYYRGYSSHFLYSNVFCGNCGAPYTRKTAARRGKLHHKYWSCKDRIKGKRGNGCKNRNIKEDELLKIISDKLGWRWVDSEHFDSDAMLRIVKRIVITDNDVLLDLL